MTFTEGKETQIDDMRVLIPKSYRQLSKSSRKQPEFSWENIPETPQELFEDMRSVALKRVGKETARVPVLSGPQMQEKIEQQQGNVGMQNAGMPIPMRGGAQLGTSRQSSAVAESSSSGPKGKGVPGRGRKSNSEVS